MLRRNEIMDFMQSDEGSYVVFDPSTGDTHFIEEEGAYILNILQSPVDIGEIILQLSAMYEADVSEIENDVKGFIDELIEKKVLIQI